MTDIVAIVLTAVRLPEAFGGGPDLPAFHTQRFGLNDGGLYPHPSFNGSKLLEGCPLFRDASWQIHISCECSSPVGIHADMMIVVARTRRDDGRV